jgi:TRAP-type transport system periplasmic protein
LIQLSMLPMAGSKGEVHALALWNTYNKYFKDHGEFKNIHLLGFFAMPSGMIASVGPSLDSSSDLKGMRVFTLPGNPAQAIDLLGAVVVVGPAVRSYELISKGTVDYYAGLNFANAVDFNQMSFTKSVKTLPGGIFSPSFSLFISKQKWDSLTPEQQSIPQFSGDYIAKMSTAFDKAEDAAIAKFKAEGISISALSDADVAALDKVWEPMRQKWVEAASAKGIDGQAALDFYMSELKRLSAEN